MPRTSTSSQLRLVDIATESKAAKATNSHPEREDKKKKIHDNPYKSPLYLYEIIIWKMNKNKEIFFEI